MEDLILNKILSIKKSLKYGEKKQEIQTIEKEMESASFWSNSDNATKRAKELSDLKSIVTKVDELELLAEMGEEAELAQKLKEAEVFAVLSGRFDASGAYLSIHAGQGCYPACTSGILIAKDGVFLRLTKLLGMLLELNRLLTK